MHPRKHSRKDRPTVTQLFCQYWAFVFAITSVLTEATVTAQENSTKQTSSRGNHSQEPNAEKLNAQKQDAPKRVGQESESSATVDEHKDYRRYRSVVYATPLDNVELLCDVYVPKGKGPFPAILMIHGGAWRSGTKLQMKGHAESAAKKKFVSVSINYRHAPRYKWPAQIDDCHTAMQWMLDHAKTYKIDKNRVAVWGYSAGGHLATYLAMKPKDDKTRWPIRCVVCGGGVVDLTLFPKDFPFLKYFMGATRRQAPDKYKQASPLTHLSKDDPPMFFYHGERDVVAPLSGVQALVKQAQRLGIKCEFMLVPKKEHILTFFDQPSFDKGLAFIEKELATKE